MSTAEATVAAAGGSIHEFRKATRKMRWWYESLADFMIANPSATQNEIATHFQRQPCTISTIVNTDAFKAYFRQRRAVHAEKIDTTVRDKLFQVTTKSLDHILTTLDKKRDNIPLEILQRTAESSLKSLGYGAAQPAVGTTVNVNTAPPSVHVAVSLDDLEQARMALRRNQMQTIDHAPTSASTSLESASSDRTAAEGRGAPVLGSNGLAEGDGGADLVDTFKDLK